MTETNIGSYTDKQLFDRAKLVTNYRRTPGIPILYALQSKEDAFDLFDDKFYFFDEEDNFLLKTSGTTNAGATGLKDYLKWNPKGTGIWKTNEMYPRCFKYGTTKGGQECLRLATEIFHYRDNNKNEKSEQIGKLYKSNTMAHFHGIEFSKSIQISKKVAKRIGGYSVMCQVANDTADYRQIINYVKPFVFCDYVLLDEF